MNKRTMPIDFYFDKFLPDKEKHIENLGLSSAQNEKLLKNLEWEFKNHTYFKDFDSDFQNCQGQSQNFEALRRGLNTTISCFLRDNVMEEFKVFFNESDEGTKLTYFKEKGMTAVNLLAKNIGDLERNKESWKKLRQDRNCDNRDDLGVFYIKRNIFYSKLVEHRKNHIISLFKIPEVAEHLQNNTDDNTKRIFHSLPELKNLFTLTGICKKIKMNGQTPPPPIPPCRILKTHLERSIDLVESTQLMNLDQVLSLNKKVYRDGIKRYTERQSLNQENLKRMRGRDCPLKFYSTSYIGTLFSAEIKAFHAKLQVQIKWLLGFHKMLQDLVMDCVKWAIDLTNLYIAKGAQNIDLKVPEMLPEFPADEKVELEFAKEIIRVVAKMTFPKIFDMEEEIPAFKRGVLTKADINWYLN